MQQNVINRAAQEKRKPYGLHVLHLPELWVTHGCYS